VGFFSGPVSGGALHLPYLEAIHKFAGKKGNGEVIFFGFVPFGIDWRYYVETEMRTKLSIQKQGYLIQIIICLVGLQTFFIDHVKSFRNKLTASMVF
jgi:hypothetical protein